MASSESSPPPVDHCEPLSADLALQGRAETFLQQHGTDLGQRASFDLDYLLEEALKQWD
ncbi:hypothetical protein [Thiohalocapsa marina]|uniref:hypothetical protein n=1 Tax=Thiohalocapsa marina TaxID=424902 RepID=UPI0014793C08|nr:hypothetical protein [Thiohalocapsa marina]